MAIRDEVTGHYLNLNARLNNDLLEGMVAVTFIKANGDERVMICTKAADIIPPKLRKLEEGESGITPGPIELTMSGRASNPEVCVVWDIEKQDWRSFRYDSIICWKVHKET